MKLIVLINLNPFFESSASSNRWCTLLEGLSNLGVDIELKITGGYHTFLEFTLLGRKGIYTGVKYQYLTFIFNHNIWLRRMNSYILIPLMRIWISLKLKKDIRYNQDSIIWSDSSYDSFKWVVGVKQKYPKLLTFLELSEFLDIHNYNKGNVLQRFKADKRQLFFETKAFFSFNGLALMTKTLFNHYQSFPKPGPQLLHLPMTVDLDRFNTTVSTINGFESPYIAFVGVMNDAKDGVSILIKAFAQMSKQFPNYKLYLIGGWNYDTPNHINLIKELNLEEKVYWKGEYQRELIPAIINNADLLALPRPDSHQAKGGFPTKLGEYLATGNPVCATRVGEIPDYLTDGESVYFAEPGSVDSFAEAMKRALCDPTEAKRIGMNGRKVAESYFNQDIQAKILYDFLKENFLSQ